MTIESTAPAPSSYPISIVFAPAGKQSRLTIFFRLVLILPALIVSTLVGTAAFVVTFFAWWIVVIAGRYPGGMFRFAVGAMRWGLRVTAYYYLLTDKYPPFSLDDKPDYPARMRVEEATNGRNRLTAFFRFFLLIPHFIIIWLLGYAVSAVAIVCWLIGIFAGRVPSSLHDFLAGYLRWTMRATGYWYLLTDRYPPFSMSETEVI